MVEQFFEVNRFSDEIEIFLLVGALSVVPFILIAFTTFTRNIIVLSMMRHAIGLPQTPPNMVLIALSLFLAIFTMHPVLEESYDKGVKPYLEDQIEPSSAASQIWSPFKVFMITQTHERDIEFIYSISKNELPENANEVDFIHLVPAFLISELSLAFKIGFIIFLPFLLVDLVMAAILTSLGMIMVPPITISLPLKIMLFVVIDGWTLISEVLVRSVGQ